MPQGPIRLRRGLVGRAQRAAPDGHRRAPRGAGPLRAGAAGPALAQPRPPRRVGEAIPWRSSSRSQAVGRRPGARQPSGRGPPRQRSAHRRQRRGPRALPAGLSRTSDSALAGLEEAPFPPTLEVTLAAGAPAGSGRQIAAAARVLAGSRCGRVRGGVRPPLPRRRAAAARGRPVSRRRPRGGRDPLGRVGDPARARPAPRRDRDHAPDGRDGGRHPGAVLALRFGRGAGREARWPWPSCTRPTGSRPPGSRGTRIRCSRPSGSASSTRRPRFSCR